MLAHAARVARATCCVGRDEYSRGPIAWMRPASFSAPSRRRSPLAVANRNGGWRSSMRRFWSISALCAQILVDLGAYVHILVDLVG
jgi:hypothetical protein